MKTFIKNSGLVEKYKAPAPRYTSYPSAPYFLPVEGSGDERRIHESVEQRNREPRNISLYFHLPFCASLCWYCGCTTVISRNQGKSAVYLDYIEREMQMRTRELNPDNRVVQLHLGGGTPTFLTPGELERLGDMISSGFNLDPKIEASVEIDPRRLTREHVSALKKAGFNRSSIGIQDFNPEVQKAVNRIQPFELTKNVVDWLRDDGFQSVNVDLIYGLPHQTARNFRDTLNRVLLLNPDRLAVFAYAHVPWMKPAQKHLDRFGLPDAGEKFEMMLMTAGFLTDHGYEHIGMDHFARPQDGLVQAIKEKRLQRNFQGYSAWADTDIYAFGMSSISQIGDSYIQNLKELPDYYRAVVNRQYPYAKHYHLGEEDSIRRKVIMRLMCDLELDFQELSENLGIDFRRFFSADLLRLKDLEADNLVVIDNNRLSVTGTGRFFLRNIAMQFDVRLHEKQDRPRFSQSV